MPNAMPLWLRALSRLPLSIHYVLASGFGVLAHRVLRYRLSVVRANLAVALPELKGQAQRRVERAFYRNLADILVEFIKAASMSPSELRSRVVMRDLHIVRTHLDAGRSVLILAAHQCNWEWLQLALSLELERRVDAAYKPPRSAWSQRLLRHIRARFGSRLVPAKELLPDILKERERARAIAVLADQEPVSSEFRWWTEFLNQPTAFYMGPEKISRAARYPMIFAAMRRLARGRYEVRFQLIAQGKTAFAPGVPTEHYARLVEAQIREHPADWMWSHRRWKLQPPAQMTQQAVANEQAL